jgi:hypothetical protein
LNSEANSENNAPNAYLHNSRFDNINQNFPAFTRNEIANKEPKSSSNLLDNSSFRGKSQIFNPNEINNQASTNECIINLNKNYLDNFINIINNNIYHNNKTSTNNNFDNNDTNFEYDFDNQNKLNKDYSKDPEIQNILVYNNFENDCLLESVNYFADEDKLEENLEAIPIKKATHLHPDNQTFLEAIQNAKKLVNKSKKHAKDKNWDDGSGDDSEKEKKRKKQEFFRSRAWRGKMMKKK